MAKLLIVTQAVDQNDQVLGFFHRWIEKFSQNFDSILVICLREGEHTLPKNVRILSLGKEKSKTKLQYISNFYSYLLKERNNYDTVFVHMNQEYVLLAGLLWRFMGKRVTMWRNHAKGNFLTKMAILLSHKVFCTSPFSFTAKYSKTTLMPVGIDTNFFTPDSKVIPEKNSLLFLGRPSKVKNVDMFVESLKILDKKIPVKAHLVGSPISDEDKKYLDKIKKDSKELVDKNALSYKSGVTNSLTRELYRQNEIYVNLTPSGSFDKTILEAMACGCLVLIVNHSLEGFIPGDCVSEPDPNSVAKKAEKLLSLDSDQKNKIRKNLREVVVQNHSLESLSKKFADLAQAML